MTSISRNDDDIYVYIHMRNQRLIYVKSIELRLPLFRSFLMTKKARAYNPMFEDGFDSKIPLHNDEAFQHGIEFKVKVVFYECVAMSTSISLEFLVYWFARSAQTNKSK